MSPSYLMFVNVYAPIGGCCSLHLQKVSLAMYAAVHVVRNQLFLKITSCYSKCMAYFLLCVKTPSDVYDFINLSR